MADGMPSFPSRYTFRIRQRVLTEFRAWVRGVEAANAQKLSMQRLSKLIDDEFFEFSDTMEVDDPFFKTVWDDSTLDPKTLKNLLTCELKLNLHDIHERTFRVLHAFLQIIEQSPPAYA